MKNTTIGVDTSANSATPKTTFYGVASPGGAVDYIPGPSEFDEIEINDVTVPVVGLDSFVGTVKTHLATPGNYVALKDAVVNQIPTVDSSVNNVVIPALSKLLAKILSTVDASLPNKDQNRAVKRIVREEFEETYYRILAGAFPDRQFGATYGSYALEPEPDKKTNVIL